MAFLDTNVLLYAISRASDEAAQAERALDLLDQNDSVVSVQVLQEFYVQATRATRTGALTHAQAAALVESWLRFRVQELNVAVLQAALAARERYRIGYWDAAIVEAARAAGCREILSEDLQHGRDYDGVRVRNPFVNL